MVHNKGTEKSLERQTYNINNQQINQEVHVIDDIEEINYEDTTGSKYYSQRFQNYFRRQNKHLVCDIDSNKYMLLFTSRNSYLISSK